MKKSKIQRDYSKMLKAITKFSGQYSTDDIMEYTERALYSLNSHNAKDKYLSEALSHIFKTTVLLKIANMS